MKFSILTKSRDEIENIQFKKIKHIVNVAYEKSEFYRRYYNERDFHPQDLKSYADINKIPIIERKILKETPVEQILTNHDYAKLHFHTTSGSSGIPVKYYYSGQEAFWTSYGWLRVYLMMGMKFTDKTVALRDPIDIKKPAFFQRLGLLRYDYYNIFNTISEIYEAISNKYDCIDILKGMPSDLLNLCYEIRKGKKKFPKVRLVLSDSEVLNDFARQYIYETLNKPVFDAYGSVENGCIGFQLAGSNKYFLNEDQVKLENRTEKDSVGDAVITNLRNTTFPIIRYQIGDVIDFGDGKSDLPGVKLQTIKQIYGKYLDFIVLPDETIISPHIPKQELTHIGCIKKFQIIQKDLDVVHVIVEPESSYTDEIEKQIISSLSKVFKNQIKICVEYDDELTKKTAQKGKKFKVIKSDIAQDFLSKSNHV